MDRGLKCVGCIHSSDELTSIHIANLLTSHGIGAMIEGGAVYGIAVRADKAEQATAILRADALKVGYGIYYFGLGHDDIVPRRPKRILARILFATALKKSDFSTSTALGRFLHSKKIVRVAAKYPYIASLAVREQQYLATPTMHKAGYNLELELRETLRSQSDGYRGRYQVWKNGRRINFLGSNEWWSSEEK